MPCSARRSSQGVCRCGTDQPASERLRYCSICRWRSSGHSHHTGPGAGFSPPAGAHLRQQRGYRPAALHDRPWLLGFELSAIRWNEPAGLRASCQLTDFLEISDTFSIFAPLVLEAAGFAPRRAAQLAAEGIFNRDGRLPLNAMGGSKRARLSAGSNRDVPGSGSCAAIAR